jgi:hypothetical protein
LIRPVSPLQSKCNAPTPGLSSPVGGNMLARPPGVHRRGARRHTRGGTRGGRTYTNGAVGEPSKTRAQALAAARSSCETVAASKGATGGATSAASPSPRPAWSSALRYKQHSVVCRWRARLTALLLFHPLLHLHPLLLPPLHDDAHQFQRRGAPGRLELREPAVFAQQLPVHATTSYALARPQASCMHAMYSTRLRTWQTGSPAAERASATALALRRCLQHAARNATSSRERPASPASGRGSRSRQSSAASGDSSIACMTFRLSGSLSRHDSTSRRSSVKNAENVFMDSPVVTAPAQASSGRLR